MKPSSLISAWHGKPLRLVSGALVLTLLMTAQPVFAQNDAKNGANPTNAGKNAHRALWDENSVPADVREAVRQVPPDKARDVEQAHAKQAESVSPKAATARQVKTVPVPRIGPVAVAFYSMPGPFGLQFPLDSGSGSRQQWQKLSIRRAPASQTCWQI